MNADRELDLLALDPGASTGWCHMPGRQFRASGRFKPVKGETTNDRILRHCFELRNLMETTGCTAVLIEESSKFLHGSREGKKRSKKEVGMALALRILERQVGAYIGTAYALHARIITVDPTGWKGGRGKGWTREIAARVTSSTIGSEDEADAIALAEWWFRKGWMTHGALARRSVLDGRLASSRSQSVLRLSRSRSSRSSRGSGQD